jgi:hypothetical protein
VSDKVEGWVGLALLVGGVYVAYKIFGAAKAGVAAVGQAQQAAGSAVADFAQSILGTGLATPGTSYTVHMADGTTQIVPYGQLPVPTSQYVAPPDPIAESLDQGFQAGG